MPRKLVFYTVCPDDTYYTWQVHAWLESLKKLGHSKRATVLIFIPSFRQKNPKWQQIINLYPETEFVFYRDEANEISSKLGIYIPVLRPWTLKKYFRDHPETTGDAVFYCDSDVLFTEGFNVDKYVEDNINYLSNTNSYINASYFDSKIKDVKPDMLEEYKKIDVLGDIASTIGISRSICEKYNNDSGGAQYLLKDITGDFWEKVETDCLLIRIYLMNINKKFFESEDKGFQSWCADMWAVLWNLWLKERETKIIPEMNFAWAPDPISRLETHHIYHNAGITGDNTHGYPAFYKGKYHKGEDPFKDVTHLQNILTNENSKKYCTHFYTSSLMDVKNKYNLNY